VNQLYFGTAGIPISTPNHNTVNGVSYVRKLGLDCMELEFVRSVNISKEKAPDVRKMAKKHKVELTCHAPYFINLNSHDLKIIGASQQRILNSARIANLCGAKSVTFHAAYYLKEEPAKVYSQVKEKIEEILEVLQEEGNKIIIRPETTGKGTQWGSVKEIVKLSAQVDQVLPCIDFAHLYARSIGKLNSYSDFKAVLEYVEKYLGRAGLNNMHIHMSGIFHGPKGERHHLTLKESEFNYSAVLRALKEFKCKGVVISESPNIEKDALLMQREYGKI